MTPHRTNEELFHVLAEQLHALVPFDYLSLLLHEAEGNELRLVVLEPADLEPPFLRKPIADHGPAATVWETQRGAVIPLPDDGPLPVALTFLRNHGRKMTAWLPLRHRTGASACSRSAAARRTRAPTTCSASWIRSRASSRSPWRTGSTANRRSTMRPSCARNAIACSSCSTSTT